jgi:hypothetical protein
MKHCLAHLSLMFLLLASSVYAQNMIELSRDDVDFPEVPRISAYEAYKQYKAGKAILIQAGGTSFEKRHIMGAYELDSESVRKGRIPLPSFPMRGIDIYTYCY